MFSSTSRLARARQQTHHATGRETRRGVRIAIVLAALITTGAFASQLVAQAESRLYYTPCEGGVLEVCGETTTYSDCGWSWKGYHVPVFPYVGVIPWYGCDTETRKLLYKNYVKLSNDLEVM